jgi:hypothetical protein
MEQRNDEVETGDRLNPCRLGRITLELATHRLRDGYARDLCLSALSEGLDEADCDALFRTLIIDEHADQCWAEGLYNAAHDHTPEGRAA